MDASSPLPLYTSSCFSTDRMPSPPLSLPVVKIPEDGFDRYHESAPQFARECLRELTERGALVLNCGMDAGWSSCLHLSSEALARCVAERVFSIRACIMVRVYRCHLVSLTTLSRQIHRVRRCGIAFLSRVRAGIVLSTQTFVTF